MRRNIILSTFFIVALLTFTSSNFVGAQVQVTVPSFPSCKNPQGEKKAYYSTGTHGIAGDTATYTGADTVYLLTADTLTQCFCAEDKSGIQTNWWKVSSLTEEEVAYLQKTGWVYIPNGAEWGLDEAPYMALNSDFSCSTGNGTDKKVNIVKNRMGQGGQGGIGDILGTGAYTGEVLGLASTGGRYIALGLLALGAVSLAVSAFFLRSDSEN